MKSGHFFGVELAIIPHLKEESAGYLLPSWKFSSDKNYHNQENNYHMRPYADLDLQALPRIR